MMRRSEAVVEKLKLVDSDEVVAEKRAARFETVRNAVVGVMVAVAFLAFGVYCVLLDSAPWWHP